MTHRLLDTRQDAITPEDRTLFHGTNAEEEFTELKPNAHGIIWLAEQGPAGVYATTHFRKGAPRLLTVKLAPAARIVDLRDLSKPVVREVKKSLEASLSGFYGPGHTMSDEEYIKRADFGLLEGYAWVRPLLRRNRVDAAIVSDNNEEFGRAGQRHHDSLAVLNPKIIDSAQPEIAKSSHSQAAGDYSFGCVMADIPEGSDMDKALAEIADAIDPEDLADKGIETHRHITIRYGLIGPTIPALNSYLRDLDPFDVTFGPTTSFPPSKGSEKAEVLIAPVDFGADNLTNFNEKCASIAEFTKADFAYKPHATIAYLKPGTAQHYTGLPVMDGERFRVKRIVISDADDKETVLELFKVNA